jgi:ubiquinone/menaquinone biosynthesis C-methylase UbiE
LITIFNQRAISFAFNQQILIGRAGHDLFVDIAIGAAGCALAIKDRGQRHKAAIGIDISAVEIEADAI